MREGHLTVLANSYQVASVDLSGDNMLPGCKTAIENVGKTLFVSGLEYSIDSYRVLCNSADMDCGAVTVDDMKSVYPGLTNFTWNMEKESLEIHTVSGEEFPYLALSIENPVVEALWIGIAFGETR